MHVGFSGSETPVFIVLPTSGIEADSNPSPVGRVTVKLLHVSCLIVDLLHFVDYCALCRLVDT